MPLHPLKTEEPVSTHVSYDKANAQFSVAVPVANREDGHVGGTAHISGESLLRAFGQPNADLLHLNKINVTGATTSSDFSYGGHFHTGESGSDQAKAIISHNRIHHIDGENERTIATHFVVPPGDDGRNVTITPPSGLGSVEFEADPDQKAKTSTAIGRELRWGKEMSMNHEDLAADCQEVTSQGVDGEKSTKSRFLVPVDVNDASCAMSKLISVNRQNPTFCDGMYHESKRQVVTNADGKKMVVMDAGHFKDGTQLMFCVWRLCVAQA